MMGVEHAAKLEMLPQVVAQIQAMVATTSKDCLSDPVLDVQASEAPEIGLVVGDQRHPKQQSV